MVKATTSLDTERVDLKSLEGGWVELRPMTYGQFLKRRDMAMKMSVGGQAIGRGLAQEKIDLDIIQEAVTRYEFSICVADHNLEDENGRKLVLSKEEDFNKLDPKVGQEIDQLITERNQWEETKRGSENSDQEGDILPEDGATNIRGISNN